MKLNQFTDFGLRITMYMAQKQVTGDATTRSELSERFNISRNHLVKIVQFLSRQGVIAARRGRGGGLQLADRSEHVKVGQLFYLLEKRESVIDCGAAHCVLTGNCSLKGALDAAYREFITVLDRYSLRDVTGGKTGIILQQLVSGTLALPESILADKPIQ